MPEYTQAIDLHISRTLSLRGFVTGDMLPGLDASEAVEMLRHYAETHSADERLDFDGSTLKSLAARREPAASAELPASTPNRGLLLWVSGAVIGVAIIALAFTGFTKAGVRHSTAWPASPDGKVALYFFGTST